MTSAEFSDSTGISDWLVSLRGVGVDRLADSLLQWLRDRRGAPTFEDDVTLVVARIAAPDSGS